MTRVKGKLIIGMSGKVSDVEAEVELPEIKYKGIGDYDEILVKMSGLTLRTSDLVNRRFNVVYIFPSEQKIGEKIICQYQNGTRCQINTERTCHGYEACRDYEEKTAEVPLQQLHPDYNHTHADIVNTLNNLIEVVTELRRKYENKTI